MTRPMIAEYNSKTGVSVTREYNDDEFAAYTSSQARYKANNEAASRAATAKVAILAKLGITADELKVLLNG